MDVGNVEYLNISSRMSLTSRAQTMFFMAKNTKQTS